MTDLSTGGVLDTLTRHASDATLPFDVRGARDARALAARIHTQVDDHIRPRLNSLDAPLLAVVGGSTGAGKSTLVNALVGRTISRAGAIRPTTRQPVLVHHPEDRAWFEGARILPSLPRVTLAEGTDEARERGAAFGAALHLVESDQVERGIAIVDAPDIDSVSEENRELAGQLLRAADLWIFVTTAHRYADAVPWVILEEAARRDITLAVVMNRIPQNAGVAHELREHLSAMLAERGVESERIFQVHEAPLAEGELLNSEDVLALRTWVQTLARDASERGVIARRTLVGALSATARSLEELAGAVERQEDEQSRLAGLARSEFDAARSEIATLTRDGALLRGEVLARWQDVVGTGEFFQGLQGWISRTRDRLGAAIMGKPRPAVQAESAIETGLVSVIIDQCANARSRTVRAWSSYEAGSALLQSERGLERDLTRPADGFRRTVEDQVRAWQRDVLELVRQEGADRRTEARILSLGVNVVGIALMVVVFASTAFIPTGLEVGAGAATAVVGQKLLESIFGDDAVRRLAKKAREALDERIGILVDGEAASFARVLASHPIEVRSEELRADAVAVERLREGVEAGSAMVDGASVSAETTDGADAPGNVAAVVTSQTQGESA